MKNKGYSVKKVSIISAAVVAVAVGGYFIKKILFSKKVEAPKAA